MLSTVFIRREEAGGALQVEKVGHLFVELTPVSRESAEFARSARVCLG